MAISIFETFTFPDTTHELRITISDQNGNPWFIGKDVCQALGLDTCCVQYTHQVRRLIIINESGLYSLIMRSRKPEAKAFKKWVTSVVLPSIRKHGGYTKGQEALPREELVSILHQHIQDNALPALLYYDHLTEHDHYPSVSTSKRKANSEYAVVKTAQEFNLPIEFVQALRSYGMEVLER